MLVEDLLIATRLEIGDVAIHPEDLDLAGLIDRTIEPVSASVEMDLERRGQAWAYADPLRVRQIIRNLVVNARRAGASFVEIHADEHDDHVTLSVVDDGPGVPEDLEDSIFEPYISMLRHEGTDPLGLGLYVSRSLANRMNGDLTYTREADRTWFILKLPLSHSGRLSEARAY